MNNNEKPLLSIIISSYKRLHLLKRTLYSLNQNYPHCKWELVLCDELSDESPLILQELYKYGFSWTYVSCSIKEFEEKTGITKYYNNPSWTNNLAFQHSSGKFVITMGNDVILISKLDKILKLIQGPLSPDHFIVYSTTFNCPIPILNKIGEYGEKLTLSLFVECCNNPLQTTYLKTLVTNYASITPRITWDLIKGYDINYLKSIAAEDSCFSRRIMTIPGSKCEVTEEFITLHQSHESRQFDNNRDFWDKGVAMARERYHNWDGKYQLEQEWPMPNYGVIDVIKNH